MFELWAMSCETSSTIGAEGCVREELRSLWTSAWLLFLWSLASSVDGEVVSGCFTIGRLALALWALLQLAIVDMAETLPRDPPLNLGNSSSGEVLERLLLSLGSLGGENPVWEVAIASTIPEARAPFSRERMGKTAQVWNTTNKVKALLLYRCTIEQCKDIAAPEAADLYAYGLHARSHARGGGDSIKLSPSAVIALRTWKQIMCKAECLVPVCKHDRTTFSVYLGQQNQISFQDERMQRHETNRPNCLSSCIRWW